MSVFFLNAMFWGMDNADGKLGSTIDASRTQGTSVRNVDADVDLTGGILHFIKNGTLNYLVPLVIVGIFFVFRGFFRNIYLSDVVTLRISYSAVVVVALSSCLSILYLIYHFLNLAKSSKASAKSSIRKHLYSCFSIAYFFSMCISMYPCSFFIVYAIVYTYYFSWEGAY